MKKVIKHYPMTGRLIDTAKILDTNLFVFNIVLRYRGNRGQFPETVVGVAPSVVCNVYFVLG
jgi:hypothetical protein